MKWDDNFDDDDEAQPFIESKEVRSKEEKTCNVAFCKKEYPKHVFLIIGNEFCERFCFYGMRAVLQTYLALQLKLSFDYAGTLYHAFAVVAYFTPILGAFIADSFIGRYWTIVSLSIVYIIGNIIMAGTTVNGGYFVGAIVGMFIIAVGTGGIKPCVSAFGADQFPSHMVKEQESFFSLFYVSINAGALLSQFITPELKSVSCFGYDSCWILAFGLPAILMIVALVLFLIGTPFYHRAPVIGDAATKMVKALCTAIVRSLQRNKKKADHWMDRAVGPDTTQQFVNDCKAVFKVLLLFVPLPFFWALFDQQGSRWTYQAQKMDSYMASFDWTMQAEQIQIANCILVIAFVPIFDMFLYPLCAKCNFLVKPLQRMVAGCSLAALSFVVIGLLQIAVQQQNDALIQEDSSTYRFRAFNVHDTCSFTLSNEDAGVSFVLAPHSSELVGINGLVGNKLTVTPNEGCPRNCSAHEVLLESGNVAPISSLTVLNDCSSAFLPNNDSFPSDVEFLFQTQFSSYTRLESVASLSVVNSGGTVVGAKSVPQSGYAKLSYSTIHNPGLFRLQVNFVNGTVAHSDSFLLQQGGSYTFAYGLNSSSPYATQLFVDKRPNAVSVFWQIIPYALISWGEIMFSITGLSFAFSQSPDSMKSILQAAWLLTSSFGNLIDIVIINIEIADKALEFFVFAGAMYIVTVIFGVMCYFYKYVDATYGSKAPSSPVTDKDSDGSITDSNNGEHYYGNAINEKGGAMELQEASVATVKERGKSFV